MSILSERLRCMRKKHKLTQGKMGEILGIKRSSYQNYEAGQSFPPISVLIKIAAAFDISIDYLTGRTDERRTLSETYDVENIMPFSVRVKALREARKLTQETVSKEIGLAFKSTYVSYERAEKEPSLPRLIALADLFGVSLDYLVGFEEK